VESLGIVVGELAPLGNDILAHFSQLTYLATFVFLNYALQFLRFDDVIAFGIQK
jgi:hypothetical protein